MAADATAERGPISGVDAGRVVCGRYRIERELGIGGLALVVLARHLSLDQLVAMKFLRREAAADPVTVERFLREGRLIAKIKSEHVVSVQDVGRTEDGTPFIVMEYLQGKDLGTIVDEGGPLRVERAVDYVLQACDAIAEAHAMGIVHRDLKPANLFLTLRPKKSAIVKVIDFGISKVLAKRADRAGLDLTTNNDRFGTPLYMSPEQLRSPTQVDERSDIWALGVVLFELLAGAPPFSAEDAPELFVSILRDAPARMGDFRTDVPAELEAAILTCLQKDPALRFRNVAELAEAIAPFGPADANERLARTRRTVAQARLSCRPPGATPPLAFEPANTFAATTPALQVDASTQPPIVAPSAPTRRAPTLRVLLPLAGAILAVAIACAAWLRPSQLASREAQKTAAPAVMRTEAAATAPASKPIDSGGTTAGAPLPIAPGAARTSAPAPAAAAVGSAAASAAARASAPPGIDRRKLFGDRN